MHPSQLLQLLCRYALGPHRPRSSSRPHPSLLIIIVVIIIIIIIRITVIIIKTSTSSHHRLRRHHHQTQSLAARDEVLSRTSVPATACIWQRAAGPPRESASSNF